MRFSRFLLVFFVLLICLPMSAQQTTATTPQAGQILLQAFRATAGTASISDVTLTGRARRLAGSDDETGTVVLKGLSSGEARADFSYPSGPRSEVWANSDSGPVGAWSGPDGTQKQIPLYNLLVDSAWFSPALMLSKLNSSPDVVASLVGTETRNGVAVEHLSIYKRFPRAPATVSALMQRDSQMEVYLDVSTLLPAAVSFNAHPDIDAGSNIPTEIEFSNYQVLSGMQVPLHIQKYFNRSLILDLKVENASANTGVSPVSFTVPSMPAGPIGQKTQAPIVATRPSI